MNPSTRGKILKEDIQIMLIWKHCQDTRRTGVNPTSDLLCKEDLFQVIRGDDQNTSPTNQKTVGSNFERTS